MIRREKGSICPTNLPRLGEILKKDKPKKVIPCVQAQLDDARNERTRTLSLKRTSPYKKNTFTSKDSRMVIANGRACTGLWRQI